MEAVLLGAGEGSRMGDHLPRLPKLFVEVDDDPIYKCQLRSLDPHCDKITIMLGYGFEDGTNPADEFDLPDDLEADIAFKIIEEWENYENSYTARRAIEDISDDVILVCGDVIFTQEVVDNLVSSYSCAHKSRNENVVGAIKGHQDEMTAVQLDEQGQIDKYGAIEGHQEIGVFILNESYISEAVSILNNHPNYWFPVIFEELPSQPVFVSESMRHEINTRSHLVEARRKFE